MSRSRWFDHPCCAPAATLPPAFWGPEPLAHDGWVDFAARLDPSRELEALLGALEGCREILDVGGGTGLLTRSIAERFGACTVVEPNLDNAAQISDGRIRVLPGRAEALPFAPDTFDGVLATWVLQYTSDPRASVGELIRVCRKAPGSRVLLVQAAPGNDLVSLYNVCARVSGLPEAHHGYLLATAAEHLEAAGFSDLRFGELPIPWEAGNPQDEAAMSRTADVLRRLHAFPGDARLVGALTRACTELAHRRGGTLRDDGILLEARWPGASQT